MKSLDKAIFVAVLAIGVVWIVGLNTAIFAGEGVSYVQVIQDGKLIAEYKLGEHERCESFGNEDEWYNVLEIDSQARVTSASCSDKICMQNVISQPNQAIVCLPNRFIVKIVGKSDEDTFTY